MSPLRKLKLRKVMSSALGYYKVKIRPKVETRSSNSVLYLEGDAFLSFPMVCSERYNKKPRAGHCFFKCYLLKITSHI